MTMRAVLAAVVLSVAAGCATTDATRCRLGETAAIDDLLYFGLSMPGGRVVGAEAWSGFLGDVVTPRFPAGLSTWHVSGQWRTADGTMVREDSVAVAVVHPDDAASDAAIRQIVDAYKQRFAQEAVLRVKRRACTAL
jgi:hypothetical protein